MKNLSSAISLGVRSQTSFYYEIMTQFDKEIVEKVDNANLTAVTEVYSEILERNSQRTVEHGITLNVISQVKYQLMRGKI